MNTDAAQIRIQLAANLLEDIAPSMEDWAANIRGGAADDQDASQIYNKLSLVRATLAILRGVRSDIPAELRSIEIYDGADAVLASDPRL